MKSRQTNSDLELAAATLEARALRQARDAEKHNRIRQLILEGLEPGIIRSRMGVSHQTVASIRKEMGQ